MHQLASRSLLVLAVSLITTLSGVTRASPEPEYPENYHGPFQQVLDSGDRRASSSSRPNIVFVLTDDQDLHMNSLDYVPLIKKNLIDKGTLYKKHFCTTAICCPARVSILTGKLSHNTNVTDIVPPYGGYPKFIARGYNENYLPVWLQGAGYNTYYTGKLFNAHHVNNYDSPFVAGWNQSDFLLDPYTYMYLNATYQRNHDAPVNHIGEHTVDILRGKALGFLDEAVTHDEPFFLGVAPIAPHSNVIASGLELLPPDENAPLLPMPPGLVGPPIPADRHKHLFPYAKVPRTTNFNPEKPSGAHWIRKLPRLDPVSIAWHDHFYRQRLRALQSVDELVDEIVKKLDAYGILDNTYIIYTTDNGYHLSQHRPPSREECGFEEDINIPLIIRGPGVPEGLVTDVVTTHIDLAPTILKLAGAPLRADFDGVSVPLSEPAIAEAKKSRHEHVTVEFWGLAVSEGGLGNDYLLRNNTYKAVRIVSDQYSLYYSVWCTNEHELYDVKTDPGQVKNLLRPEENGGVTHLLGAPLEQVRARLDSLLFVLKSCKGITCTQPWKALHPAGNVVSLQDALSVRFDEFYVHQQQVSFSACEAGYLVNSEGPQFESEGLLYRDGIRWSEWA